jgi:clan AA aspartic protease
MAVLNPENVFNSILLYPKGILMGAIYADIELINNDDLALVRRNIIDKDEVRRMYVNIRVDTGADMLCINESIQEQLQFPILEKRKAQLANGSFLECEVASSVELHFKNRRTICNAMILPGDAEPLLGCIPLEDMDVLIHPLRQELIVNPDHPYYAQMKIK